MGCIGAEQETHFVSTKLLLFIYCTFLTACFPCSTPHGNICEFPQLPIHGGDDTQAPDYDYITGFLARFAVQQRTSKILRPVEMLLHVSN